MPTNLIKPVVGAALIVAADRVKQIPAWMRIPLAALGTYMVVKNVPVLNNNL